MSCQPAISLALTTAETHACAATSAGVYGWGSNTVGQLADSPAASPTFGLPTLLDGFEGAEGVAAGGFNTCAVFGGIVKCVGERRLVVDGGPPMISPESIANLTDAKQLAVGHYFGCALRAAGGPAGKPSVACWGSNDVGQLGNGTIAASAVPTQVALP